MLLLTFPIVKCLKTRLLVNTLHALMFSLSLCSVSLSVLVQLLVKNLQFEDGKMIAASQYFRSGGSAAVELTEEEKAFAGQMRVGILILILFQ